MEIDTPSVHEQNEFKLRRVLEKFLDPEFRVKNDIYINSLFSHIINLPDGFLRTNLIFSEWIEKFVNESNQIKNQISPSILSFSLNLAGFISRDESFFVKLNGKNVYETLINACNVKDSKTTPTVKLAFVNLLAAFLAHKSGLQWIMATNYWTDVYDLTLKRQTVYIAKEGYNFLTELLEKTVKINESFCENALQTFLQPLRDTPHLPNLEIHQERFYKTLQPTLHILTEIMERLMDKLKTTDDITVLRILSQKFCLEELIRSVLTVAQTEDFVYDLSRILLLLAFFEHLQVLGGTTVAFEEKELAKHIEKLFSVLMFQLGRTYLRNVLKLTYNGFVYWRCIACRMPVCFNMKKDKQIFFEDQFLMFYLIPVLNMGGKMVRRSGSNVEPNDREDYLANLTRRSGMKTIHTGYRWRELLISLPNVFDVASLSLMYLLKSKNFLNRDLASLALQGLIYCLKDIVDNLKQDQSQIPLLSKECNFTEQLLHAIAVFIEEFDLSWKDNIATICVMGNAFDFLSIPMWSPKQVVRGLKLVDIAISKYMSPNMALLVDSTKDSSLDLLGPMLYAKLHDSSWEVRDSALEVLRTISHNANTKFPSFQTIVMDAELPHLVVKMATRDGESFVRASALKCLQEMIQVRVFWQDLMNIEGFHEQIMEILHKETEGIVRKEAATLICQIYEHQTFPDAITYKLYDIMSHSATSDLHWETKISALQFWEKVVEKHLQHQGMIDGTFPKVTFSKEHKKIVTLNDMEVQKRLIKVLNQLSHIGCLSVYVTAIQDDCDVEVSKVATGITKKFVDLLRQYEVTPSSANLSQPPSPLTPGLLDYNMRSQNSPKEQKEPAQVNPVSMVQVTDEILDEILNASDVNLLQRVYNPGDTEPEPVKIKSRKQIAPSEFLGFTFGGLETHEDNKRVWLSGLDDFDSLMDDILKEYDVHDVNSMDCY